MILAEVISPNEKVSIRLILNDGGQLYYMAAYGEKTDVYGRAGIVTTAGDLSQGLMFVSTSGEYVIDELYHLPAGKKKMYRNHCRERNVLLSSGNGTQLSVRLRAYDDGVAFRYEIGSDKAVGVFREATDFTVAEDFNRVWLQNLVQTYEGPYIEKAWGPENDGMDYAMPVLVRSTDGRYLLMNEAGVMNSGDYCSSHLLGTDGKTLRLRFPPNEKLPMMLGYNSRTPWRYICMAENADILVNSVLAYNLNPPSIVEDESWIRPGRALWAWWADDTGAHSFSKAMQYVDTAAAYGFEAVTIDAGWDASWIPALCSYAHGRGVAVWIWSHQNRFDSQENIEYYFRLFKSWGVDGVKIDVFEDDSSEMCRRYKAIAEETAKDHLMINYHGCTKPMGEGRTWPHLLTSEGIMGMEYYKWSDGPDSVHNCTVPFIRNAVGPMDYTPVGFSHRNRNTSLGHQLALSVVFESGCTHFASTIYNLEPWNGTEFLRRLKPVYDGMQLLEGAPGQYVSMLRWKSETQEYYIGCICTDRRIARIRPDFLPEGIFEAEIYADDRLGNKLVRRKEKVSRDTTLEIPLVNNGGAGIYIARRIEEQSVDAGDGYMCTRFEELIAENAECFHGSMIRNCSDQDGRTVVHLSGSCAFEGTGTDKAENVTVRIFYSSEVRTEIKLSDGHTTLIRTLPISGYCGTFAVQDIVFPLPEGPYRLVLERTGLQAPDIRKVRVIRNHPVIPTEIPAASCVLKGGCLSVSDRQATVFGMGPRDEISVKDLTVRQGGTYILRIHFFAGVAGSAEVAVNGGEAILCELGGGLSMWSSVQENDPLEHEILIHLEKGRNDLRFRATSTLPDIAGFDVIPYAHREKEILSPPRG